MVVKILTRDSIILSYRFYGARHSVLQLGYLIDFELEHDKPNFLPRLRNITHIGFPWLYNRDRLFLWHQYINLFSKHFKDVAQIESFYYEKLLEIAKKWHKQSPKRLIIESFVEILRFEGRLYSTNLCAICSKEIDDEEIALLKDLLPAHKYCANSFVVKKRLIDELYRSGLSWKLDDDLVESISNLIIKSWQNL